MDTPVQDCRVLCTRNNFPAHVPASSSYFPAELAQRVATSITGAETTTAGVPVPVASILLGVSHGPERTSLKTLRARFVCNTRATTTLLMQPNHPPNTTHPPKFHCNNVYFLLFLFFVQNRHRKTRHSLSRDRPWMPTWCGGGGQPNQQLLLPDCCCCCYCYGFGMVVQMVVEKREDIGGKNGWTPGYSGGVVPTKYWYDVR